MARGLSPRRSPDDRFRYFDKFSWLDVHALFVFEKILGGGHFGSVYSAHSHGFPERKYAVKTIQKNKISERSLKRLEQEFEILASVDHPNLVKYFGTYHDSHHIHIVMEQCKGGEVFERI